MNKQGPIIVIEDNTDDQLMFEPVFKEFNYPNELVFFGDSVDALAYLTKTDIEPFIIFSDTKMPKLDRME